MRRVRRVRRALPEGRAAAVATGVQVVRAAVVAGFVQEVRVVAAASAGRASRRRCGRRWRPTKKISAGGDRLEKQRNDRKRPGEGRPKEEDRERGKWRWDGSD